MKLDKFYIGWGLACVFDYASEAKYAEALIVLLVYGAVFLFLTATSGLVKR